MAALLVVPFTLLTSCSFKALEQKGSTAGDSPDSPFALSSPSGFHVLKVVTGESQSCALLSNRRVKCWGQQLGAILLGSDRGLLGDGVDNDGNPSDEMGTNLAYIDLGTETGSNTPLRVKDLTAGLSHACVLLNNNKIKCWGLNTSGQLGIGPQCDSNNKCRAVDYVGYGGDPIMGDDLPYVDLGTEAGSSTPLTAKAVMAGYNHTCAILNNDKVKCWGNNQFGQLGLGHTDHLGDGVNDEMGDNLSTVDLGTGLTAKGLAMGGAHSCVILNNNKAKCWGSNDRGQLGQGHGDDLGNEAGEMGDNLSAIELGTGLTVKSLSLGENHSCAILSNGKVKCWGNQNEGQLGLGRLWIPSPSRPGETQLSFSLGSRPNEMGDSLSYVDLGTAGNPAVPLTAQFITAGQTHTCVVLSNDRVRCWGSNGFGQLGLGHADDMGGDPGSDSGEEGTVGDDIPLVDLGTSGGSQLSARGISFGFGHHTCAFFELTKLSAGDIMIEVN